MYDEMEKQLTEAMEMDEVGMVDYEEYLPTMVMLIKAVVNRNDQLEIANELFDVWYPDSAGPPMMPYGRNQLFCLLFEFLPPAGTSI